MTDAVLDTIGVYVTCHHNNENQYTATQTILYIVVEEDRSLDHQRYCGDESR